jgi:hypothetical protein
MRLKSTATAILVFAIVFGSVVISSAAGYWRTTAAKEASKFESGDFAGEANPADIRGSFSFGDIEKSFGIEATTLAKAFGVPEEEASTFQVKALESLYAMPEGSEIELGTGSVRYFVSLYTGLPYVLTETVYLPDAAVQVLIDENKVSDEQANALWEIAVDLADLKQP